MRRLPFPEAANRDDAPLWRVVHAPIGQAETDEAARILRVPLTDGERAVNARTREVARLAWGAQRLGVEPVGLDDTAAAIWWGAEEARLNLSLVRASVPLDAGYTDDPFVAAVGAQVVLGNRRGALAGALSLAFTGHETAVLQALAGARGEKIAPRVARHAEVVGKAYQAARAVLLAGQDARLATDLDAAARAAAKVLEDEAAEDARREEERRRAEEEARKRAEDADERAREERERADEARERAEKSREGAGEGDTAGGEADDDTDDDDTDEPDDEGEGGGEDADDQPDDEHADADDGDNEGGETGDDQPEGADDPDASGEDGPTSKGMTSDGDGGETGDDAEGGEPSDGDGEGDDHPVDDDADDEVTPDPEAEARALAERAERAEAEAREARAEAQRVAQERARSERTEVARQRTMEAAARTTVAQAAAAAASMASAAQASREEFERTGGEEGETVRAEEREAVAEAFKGDVALHEELVERGNSEIDDWLREHRHYLASDETAKPGRLTIEEVPLPRRLSRVYAQEARLSREGSNLYEPFRLFIDGYCFREGGGGEEGGGVLIDTSGSMSLSLTEIELLVRCAPAVNVAVYGGWSDHGVCRIVARGQKMAEQGHFQAGNGSNIVDIPALREWLRRQPHPRVWVSDGLVTGCHDALTKGLIAEAQTLCRIYGIVRVPSVAAALRLFRKINPRTAAQADRWARRERIDLPTEE